jgi:hypothetical protein
MLNQIIQEMVKVKIVQIKLVAKEMVLSLRERCLEKSCGILLQARNWFLLSPVNKDNKVKEVAELF